MSVPVRVGLVGCGSISEAYAQTAPGFRAFQLVACADNVPQRARALAGRYGLRAYTTVDTLLSDPDVELVLNLTPPAAHASVTCAGLEAGKHVYCEKPLATSPAEARRVLDLAHARGRRVGVTPDTFLGRAVQTARALIDAGAIGEPVAATALMMNRGHEGWHPEPGFYYQPGGGPLLDMGMYHLAALITLLGPVRRVSGAARASFPYRVVAHGPRAGQHIPVETPTHVTATVEFAAGPLATLVMSFDVWTAAAPDQVEVYGSEGTLRLPEPNGFDGPVHIWTSETRTWLEAALLPGAGPQACGLGLADMAAALRAGQPHRANGVLGFHVLEAACGTLESARSGRHVTVMSSCERPAPLRTTLSV